jgi:uncharacterized protein (TIGR03066 family)
LGLVALGGPLAADDKDDKKDAAKQIVGKWEVVKGTQPIPPGTVIEFTKDGKLKLTINDMTVEGTYTVEKDQLKSKITTGDQTSEDTDTIKKLTDDELDLENTDKLTLNLKRKK